MHLLKSRILIVAVVFFLGTACSLSRSGIPASNSRWLTLVPAAEASPQPAPIVHPEWTSYIKADLAQDMLFDQNGDFWVATDNGVVHWNLRDNSVTRYGTEHGLASDLVFSLVMGADGSIWAGTDGGISHFDGERWVSFTPGEKNYQNSIRDAVLAANGTLWFGGGGGVWRFSNDEWQLYSNAEGLKDHTIYSLVARSNGTVCAVAFKDSYCFDGKQWQRLAPPESEERISSLAEGKDGILWATARSGLFSFDGKKWVSYGGDDLSLGALESVYVDSNNQVWMEAGYKGIAVLEGNKVEFPLLKSGESVLPDFAVNVITGPDGKPVVATFKKGIYRFVGDDWEKQRLDPAFWVRYSIENPEIPEVTYSVAVAPDGTLWTGNDPDLASFDGKQWKSYHLSVRLIRGSGLALDFASDGSLWIGTTGGGVFHFDGKNFKNYTVEDGLAGSGAIYATAVTSDGAAWFSVAEPFSDTAYGLSRFDGQSWTTFTKARDGLAGDRIYDLAAAPDGSLWVGADGGLSHYVDGKWTTYTTDDGLLDNWVFSLAVSKEGVVWAGSEKGLTRFDGKSWQTYTAEKDGLTSGSVTYLAVAGDGSVWAAVFEAGVMHFDGRKWTAFTSLDGLAHNDVTDIAITPDGAVWFATRVGLSRYQP